MRMPELLTRRVALPSGELSEPSEERLFEQGKECGFNPSQLGYATPQKVVFPLE